MPLLLWMAGCGWISEEGLFKRVDRDGDLYLLGTDCADDDSDLQTLDDVQPAPELQCGQSVSVQIGDGDCTNDDVDDDAEGVVARVLPCADPLEPDQYIPPLFNQLVFRLRPDHSTDVRVHLTSECLNHVAQEDEVLFDLEPAAPLLANHGATCGVDHCVIGSPVVRYPQLYVGSAEALDARVDFHAQPDEDWYIVVSSGNGMATLTVECLSANEDTG